MSETPSPMTAMSDDEWLSDIPYSIIDASFLKETCNRLRLFRMWLMQRNCKTKTVIQNSEVYIGSWNATKIDSFQKRVLTNRSAWGKDINIALM